MIKIVLQSVFVLALVGRVRAEECDAEDSVIYFACEYSIYQLVAPMYVATRIYGVSERMCLLEAGLFKATNVVYCPSMTFCGIDMLPDYFEPNENASVSEAVLTTCKIYTFTADDCELVSTFVVSMENV